MYEIEIRINAVVQQRSLAVYKRIDYGHFVSEDEEIGDQGRTDITGSAGNQYFHFRFS